MLEISTNRVAIDGTRFRDWRRDRLRFELLIRIGVAWRLPLQRPLRLRVLVGVVPSLSPPIVRTTIPVGVLLGLRAGRREEWGEETGDKECRAEVARVTLNCSSELLA